MKLKKKFLIESVPEIVWRIMKLVSKVFEGFQNTTNFKIFPQTFGIFLCNYYQNTINFKILPQTFDTNFIILQTISGTNSKPLPFNFLINFLCKPIQMQTKSIITIATTTTIIIIIITIIIITIATTTIIIIVIIIIIMKT